MGGEAAAECFVGEWTLDSQRFFDDVVAMSGAAFAGASIEVRGGANVLTIRGDGTMTGERRAWSWAMLMDMGELQVTATASQPGTYTIDGDVLSASVGTGEPPVMEMLLDGKPIPNLPQMEMQEAVAGVATMTCNGDVLTALSGDGFTSVWNRS